QHSSLNRLEEMQQQLLTTTRSIEGTRTEWTQLVSLLNELKDKLRTAESDYKETEQQFNSATQSYNEFNLQGTRQQSRINALVQEEAFKKNQQADLSNQVEVNAVQLKQTAESIAENSTVLSD